MITRDRETDLKNLHSNLEKSRRKTSEMIINGKFKNPNKGQELLDGILGILILIEKESPKRDNSE